MSLSRTAYPVITVLVIIALVLTSGGVLNARVEAAVPAMRSNLLNGQPAPMSAPLPLPTLPAPPAAPTTYDLLHHGAPSTPWTSFAGPGVNVVFGNFVWQELDLSVPGRGLGFAFLRTYNSADPASGPLGRGWTHSYNLSLTVESPTSILIRMGDSRLDRYTLSGSMWVPPVGVFNDLVDNGDSTFTLRLKDQTRYNFDVSGRLASIADRNNNTVMLTYTAGNLARISDPTGREFVLGYDASNHLTSITDPLTRTVTFSYTVGGDLAGVTDVRDKITTYGYDANHRLISLTNANDHAQFTLTYDAQNRVMQSVDAETYTTIFAYNFNIGQSTVTDPRLHATIYGFDADYRFIGVEDPLGFSTLLTYDSSNNVRTLRDKRGYSTGYQYDDRGNVMQITDPLTHTVRLTYNALNDPLTIVNQRNFTTTLAYDANGNLLTITDPLDHLTRFDYDSYGQVITVTDALSRVVPLEYDTVGNLKKITDALEKTTSFDYDLAGRMLGLTDPRTATTHLAYDAADHPTEVIDAFGNISRFTYDAVGNQLSVMDALSRTTSFEYDARNLLVTATDPVSGTTHYEYDGNGNLTRAIDPNNHATHTEYDTLNRAITVTDALSNTAQYEYDANGNLTRLIDPTGQSTTTEYDELNRVVRVANALGFATTYEYDAAGNQTAVIDANGVRTAYGYDALNRLVSVTDALGNSVHYEYDTVGNRTAVINARNQRSTYGFDALNRVITETDPLSNTLAYTYDENSNLLTSTDANGKTTTWTYDALNRISEITYPAAGDVTTNTVHFGYDAIGNRIRMTDTTGITHYAFDNLNRLISVTNPISQMVQYQYDPAGNRTRIIYPDAAVANFGYDNANRLTSVSNAGGSTHYTYNARGERTRIDYANGIVGTFIYDQAGRLTDIRYTSPIVGNYLAISYALDKVGNRTQMLDDEGLTAYSYDALYRLRGVIYPDQSFQQFGYDAAGNRLVMTDTLGTTHYTYDAADRLTHMTTPTSTVTFGWDNNGNMLSRSDGTTYMWDAANRLTKAVIGHNGVTTDTVEFAYDGDGRRTSKSINGVVNNYLWDTVPGLPVILNQSSGDQQTDFVYGHELLAMTAAGTHSFYHADGLGSTRSLSASSGEESDSYRYDAFGAIRSQAGATTNPFLFTGQQLDLETRLYYLRARYYDPSLGIFLSIDPAESGESYLYASNNPANMIDPTGLSSSFLSAIGGFVKKAVSAVTYTVAKVFQPITQFIQPITQPAYKGPSASMPTPVPAPGPSRAINNPAPRQATTAIRSAPNTLIPFPVPTPIRPSNQSLPSILGIGKTIITNSGRALSQALDAPGVSEALESAAGYAFGLACLGATIYLPSLNCDPAAASQYGQTLMQSIDFFDSFIKMNRQLNGGDASTSYEGPSPDILSSSDIAKILAQNGQLSNRMNVSTRGGFGFNGASAELLGGRTSNSAYDQIPSIPGPPSTFGHSPNKPILLSPGDWYVAWDGVAPELCAWQKGDIDGNPIIAFEFDIQGANLWNAIVASNCVTPAGLGYYTFGWRVRVWDSTFNASEWSDMWHFTLQDQNFRIDPIRFSPDSPSNNEIVRVWTCVRGYSGPGAGLNVYVNTANNGTDSGEWRHIGIDGQWCFDENDPNKWVAWSTRDYGDGTHLVRAEGLSNNRNVVTEATYTLNHRRPADAVPIAPAKGSWMADRAVTFRWNPVDRADSYILQVSTQSNPQFAPLFTRTLDVSTTIYSYTFTRDHPSLYWNVLAVNELGQSLSAVTPFGVDSEPPGSAVNPLPAAVDRTTFPVSWSGLDAISGIKFYDIQYRDTLSGTWQFWKTQTAETSALFTGQDGHTYYFRARAIDGAGNVEAFPTADAGDAFTHVDTTTPQPAPWWRTEYAHRQRIEISTTQGLTQTVPQGYAIKITTDVGALIGAGKVRSDLKDWRLAYWDGVHWTELDRDVISTTQTYLALQSSLEPGQSDAGYYVYYSQPTEPADPPADRSRIYRSGILGDYYAYTSSIAPTFETFKGTFLDPYPRCDLDTIEQRTGTVLTAIRWQGQLYAPFDETYTFSTIADDGVRAWVDDTQVLDFWPPLYINAEWTGSSLALAKGWHRVKVEFFNSGGPCGLMVYYQSPSHGKSVLEVLPDNLSIAPTLIYRSEETYAGPPPTPTPTATIGPTATPHPAAWWNSAYLYRRQIVVSAGAVSIPAPYWGLLRFDLTQLGTKRNGDYSNVRVVYTPDGTNYTELDRLVQGSDHIYFPIDHPVSAGTSDDGYWLYYGAASPGTVLANRSNIFTPRLDASTTGLWYFDEGTGSTSSNLVPGGSAVNNLGAPNAFHWGGLPSRYTDRYLISSANQQNSLYATIADYAGLRPSDLTVEMFISGMSVDSGDGYIIQKGIPGRSYAILMRQGSQTFAVQLSQDGTNWWTLGGGLPASNYLLPNGFAHIALTYDSATGHTRFFANGQIIFEGNAPFTGPLYGGSDYAQLGSPYAGPQYFSRFTGGISMLRVSNVARSSFPYAAIASVNDPAATIGGEEFQPGLPTPTATPTPTPPPPFWGDGTDGNHTVSGTEYTDNVRAALTANADGGTRLVAVADASGFTAGDEVFLIQMQGTAVGTHEFARIASIAGNTLTLQGDLQNFYVVGSNSKAQAIRVLNWNNVNVLSGSLLTVHTWDGSTGGVLVFRAGGTISVTNGGAISASARGYRGGAGGTKDSSNANGWSGESYNGLGTQTPGEGSKTPPNLGGGGGGAGRLGGGTGGGGGAAGYGTAGQKFTPYPSFVAGEQGSTYGDYALVSLLVGSGGGGGGAAPGNPGAQGGAGGRGGGIVYILAREINIAGLVTVAGEGGEYAPHVWEEGGGGGGSGGSLKLKVDRASLGNGLAFAGGGASGPGSQTYGNYEQWGGIGGDGRIRIEYCSQATGTSDPAVSPVQMSCPFVPTPTPTATPTATSTATPTPTPTQTRTPTNSPTPTSTPTPTPISTNIPLFGDGSDGDLTVSGTYYADSVRAALGSDVAIGQYTISVSDSSGFAPNQEVLVIQVRGSGAGTYEFKTIASVGSGTLTFQESLVNSYSSIGNNRAQVQRVPHYRDVIIQNDGTLAVHLWDGNTGGILALRSSGSLVVMESGRIDLGGAGFRGGSNAGDYSYSQQGESYPGVGIYSRAPNGGGGGGGGSPNGGGPGAGGGYGSTGQDGDCTSSNCGLGGNTYGVQELSQIHLGSGGGGLSSSSSPSQGGGNGGGIIIVIARQVSVLGTVSANGSNGGNQSGAGYGAGGGSGGAILIKTAIGNIGFNLVTATGGLGGQNIQFRGGNGGVGRIRIEFSDLLSGTSNPAASVYQYSTPTPTPTAPPTSTPTPTPSAHSISLAPGWNLISFNRLPPDTSITAVLASISGNYDLVYAWDGSAQQWRKYDAGAPPYVNTLNNLQVRQGFWLHMVTASTLSVAGSVPTMTDVGLSSGWNLVGYPASVARALPGALSDHGVGNFTLVYSYRASDQDQWKLFDRAAPPYSNDLMTMSPGWGYWIKCSADTIWTVPYSAP